MSPNFLSLFIHFSNISYFITIYFITSISYYVSITRMTFISLEFQIMSPSHGVFHNRYILQGQQRVLIGII